MSNITTNSVVTYDKSKFEEDDKSVKFNDCSLRERHSSSGFEHVRLPVDNTASNEDGTNIPVENFQTLTNDVFKSVLDVDGCVVNEAKLRKAVFNGGCTPEIRSEIWGFLFELYPMKSTKRERDELLIQNCLRYHALKQQSSELLKDRVDLSPIVINSEICASTFGINEEFFKVLQQTAEIYAKKQQIDLESINNWLRIVDKDIPRTDIDHPYFHENQDTSSQMRNILITFGVYHPNIGYVQGMNDILTRFLIALQSEADAYWCFAKYMESVEEDFSENGMIEKMEHVCSLLNNLEPNLLSHFDACSVPGLLFCHRWLLVSFKREFEYEESIQYFEIAQSKHLQFNSGEALLARDQQHRQEVLKSEGKAVSYPTFDNIKYTWDVFVCVSVIMLKRQEFLACKDASDVFTVACNIRGSLNLQAVHRKAYGLFLKYCKKYTEENCGTEKSKGRFSWLPSPSMPSLSMPSWLSWAKWPPSFNSQNK